MTSVTTARTSLAVMCFFVCTLPAALATAGPVTLQVLRAGTTMPQAAAPGGGDYPGNIEIPFPLGGDEEADEGGVEIDGVFNPRPFVNRRIATGSGQPVPAVASRLAKSKPELMVSFDGLNGRDQTFANGRSQFEWEPPDQGLCVGNGFVIESVNSALRVYNTAGNPLTGAIDLNTFYGYPPAIQPTVPRTFGPDINDPSCYFDPDTQRWFHVALSFDVIPATDVRTGVNHVEIAVSQTANPLGPWTLYRVPLQNDGTEGTPNHGCVARVKGVIVPGPCFGDQPRIGADSNAFFVSTNEFNFFAPGFRGAQVYAFSKRALAASGPTVNAVLFDTADRSEPGFSISPAISPAGIYDTGDGGTEFFLSADAVFQSTFISDHVLLWAVSNTQAIDSVPSALALSVRAVQTLTYSVPIPKSDQKAGDLPLRDCLADTVLATPTGFGCWRRLGVSGGPFVNLPTLGLDSDNQRMKQVAFANGKLWGALGTPVLVNGETRAGIAYFVLNPHSGNIIRQGIIAVPGNNVTYPALAVTPSGRGVMTFTLVGQDHFPSAAYVGLDAKIGAGDLHVAAEGVGPEDGFSMYPRVFGVRPRWGDYGAAAVDGNSIWIASEYIAQTCTLARYEMEPFGQCGGTRTAGLNWATRISEINTALEISVSGPQD
jgi:hypothetical protein